VTGSAAAIGISITRTRLKQASGRESDIFGSSQSNPTSAETETIFVPIGWMIHFGRGGYRRA
jgi:hypothetical protein